jgi:N-acetylneuraminic acid mutarotase
MSVGGGATVEVIDLESSRTTCKNLPNFPIDAFASFGGLGFEEKPLVCGGNSNEGFTSKCYTLKDNVWIPSANFNTEIGYAAISPSPYPLTSHKLLVTGGFNDSFLSTFEVLTKEGWKTISPSLPVKTSDHCAVLVNSATIMIIGGFNNEKNTYYFNSQNEKWVQGPQLEQERRYHSCGRIMRDKQTLETSIIVVGGKDQSKNYLSSVEILDERSNVWRQGPELPFEIYGSQMIEDRNGGVVLIGGKAKSGDYLNTLFHLPLAGQDARWRKMEQKLKSAQYRHTAFLIPDDIVECS